MLEIKLDFLLRCLTVSDDKDQVMTGSRQTTPNVCTNGSHSKTKKSHSLVIQ
jgi:hypothetical protein